MLHFPRFNPRPSGYLGVAGDITYDTTLHLPVVHDGVMPGGRPISVLPFASVAQMLASDWPAMGPGWTWLAGPYRYRELDPRAGDAHLETAQGVRLALVLEDETEVHASAFGLIDSPDIDQFDAASVALRACSDARVALNIDGLEIRIGKRETSDDRFKYVAANREGSRRGYALFLPSDGFLKLVGTGVMGNLNPDDRQYLLHGVDCDYVEIGDGVTLDGHHTRQGWGGCLHLMGCERLHLGCCTFYRDDIVRFGASTKRRSGLLTFTRPRFLDGWGTHCIGGKPGGFREVQGEALYFENCRGGFNAETEDEDLLNDDGRGNPLWNTKIRGRVELIESNGLNGDKDPEAPCAADTFFASEASGAEISVGKVIGRNHVSSRGNAGCVTFGGGQTDQPYATLDIGEIEATSVLQALRYDATGLGGERVTVGRISGDDIGVVVKARAYRGIDGPPGRMLNLRIDNIDVLECDRIFDIRNTGNQPGSLIDALDIGALRVGRIRKSVGPMPDIGKLELRQAPEVGGRALQGLR